MTSQTNLALENHPSLEASLNFLAVNISTKWATAWCLVSIATIAAVKSN
jgi:hypothetical protein